MISGASGPTLEWEVGRVNHHLGQILRASDLIDENQDIRALHVDTDNFVSLGLYNELHQSLLVPAGQRVFHRLEFGHIDVNVPGQLRDGFFLTKTN